MADSSLLDNALIALLGADAILLGLCPNGVYYDEAPPGSTRFVIVSLVDENDQPIFGARGFEEGRYLVKAVMSSTAGGDVKAAAARIDQLLDYQNLTASGYSITIMRRTSRVRLTEVDDLDASIRWQHRGGFYEVVAST